MLRFMANVLSVTADVLEAWETLVPVVAGVGIALWLVVTLPFAAAQDIRARRRKRRARNKAIDELLRDRQST